jgi:hypothetical protein
VLAGHGSPAGADAAFETAWQGAVQALVSDLEAVAARCNRGGLFRTRNEIYELILTFDPDHAAARKWLKYKRQDGRWVRAGRYKPPRNLAKQGLDEADAALREVGEAFAARVTGELAAPLAGPDGTLRPEVVRAVLRVAPDREDLRRANGEVLSADGAWMLKESVRALARRSELAMIATQAVTEATAPVVARPAREENQARVGWTRILQGRHVRLLGTPTAEELERCERHVEASFRLFGAAAGVSPPAGRGLTMYVLATATERAMLLTNHPDSNPKYKEYGLGVHSSWLPKGRALWIMDGRAPKRLEWCVRQAVGYQLGHAFGVRGKKGWAFEGFGLYLGHLLTGTRSTYFIRRTKYGEKRESGDKDLWGRLVEPGADWHAEARVLLAGPRRPDLRLLLGKDVNQMDTEEMLYSFVLAAYCLEGRERDVAPLLRAFGKEKLPPDDAVRKGLGLGIGDLEQRVRRWLDEVR